MGREEEETRGGKRKREKFFQKEKSGWRLKGEGGGGKDRKTNGREEERKKERERGHRARVCFASAPRQVDKFACFISFFFFKKRTRGRVDSQVHDGDWEGCKRRADESLV